MLSSGYRPSQDDYWDYLHTPSFGPAYNASAMPRQNMRALDEDDFGGQGGDPRFVGHLGGAWGAVAVEPNRGDTTPFVPQMGPGWQGAPLAFPGVGVGVPARALPIPQSESEDDISEEIVSDDESEEEETEPVPIPEPEPVPEPIPLPAPPSVEQYLGDLLESVDKDNREADKLNQVPGPIPEEEPKQVPVLDPVTAGVMNAAARGDHASAVALLQEQQASKTASKKTEEEAEKNELYRLELRKKPRWEPGAKKGRDEPYKIRAAKGPLNTNAQGVRWVQPPKPRNRPYE